MAYNLAHHREFVVIEKLVPIAIAFLVSILSMYCLKYTEEHNLWEDEIWEEISVTTSSAETSTVFNDLKSTKDNTVGCPPEAFRLQSMPLCRSFLACEELFTEVHLVTEDIVLTYGPVRLTRLAKWGKKLVSYSIPANMEAEEAFSAHLALLKALSASRNVAQLIGYCDMPGRKAFVTEYYRHGSALKANDVLRDNVADRLRLCVSYAEILKYVHHSPLGKMVLYTVTDNNNVNWLLRQMMIASEPLRLVLNDFDNLRLAEELNSTVSSPTNWSPVPHLGEPRNLFDEEGEKRDIWMAPRVCNVFLRDKDKLVKNHLQDIHKQCRDRDPVKRPDAVTLVKNYKEILQRIQVRTQLAL